MRVRLGAVCSLRAGIAFPLEHQGLTAGEIPFIKVSDMDLPENGTRIVSARNWLGKEQTGALGGRTFPSGTVVFAKIGEALKANRFRLLTRPTLIDNNMMGACPNPDIVDPRFFFYAMRQFDLSDVAQGTALPYLTQGALQDLEFDLPSFANQHAIAHILGSLDDKIELNRRVNQTLEEICRALFKFWFVDFGPVRAKAEGRWKKGESLPGMSADMWDLWPSEFEDSEIGEIPRGWRVAALGTLVENVSERVEANPDKDHERYIALDDMPSKSIALNGFRSGTEVNSSIIRFRIGDILFGAMRPYFHKVGLAQFDGITRSTTLVLRPRDGTLRPLALFTLASPEVIEYATAASVGTTIPYVHWKSLADYPVILPSQRVLLRFAETCAPMLQVIGHRGEETRILSETRDALLPKLLSGEIRVPIKGGA